MSDKIILHRRRLIASLAMGGGGLLLSGCDALNENARFRGLLGAAEGWNDGVQRTLAGTALAREYRPADMSPVFRANGTVRVENADYRASAARGFADWALLVDGLVAHPLRLPLSALQAMPQRAQITRHDCVEGWSAIGKWQGPQLGPILQLAGILPAARYIVLHCADRFGATPYYESIALDDALHPQTILAWMMNDAPLTEAHGAPLRLRVERQLGYKHAKFVMRVEARDRIDNLYGGRGGYWEDAGQYSWYAGI